MSDPNLLVVCVDCLRQDHVTAEQTVTPFLDGLRERGLACTNLFSTTTTTTPAVASLLTGTYSERNGVLSLRRGTLADEVTPLPAALRDAGYHTEALVTGPLLPETGLDRGFDEYRHRDESASVFGEWVDTATERLSSLPESFAAYVHLWELHEDVTVPTAYDDPEYGETPYARALSALDPKLEALADAVPDDTVVAVTGDHGESVTHRHNPLRLLAKVARDAVKYYGGVDTSGVVNRLNRALADRGPDVTDHFIENGHGENVFDFTTNVPFVVAGPGVEAATVDAQVRQVDVTPTLLHLLGLADTADADGVPIRPGEGVEDRPAYMRACGASLHRERNWARAIRAEGGKYVVHPDRDWAPRVYDLETDPAELAPADDPELERRLERLLPESGPPATEAERLDIDDHLKSLGYR